MLLVLYYLYSSTGLLFTFHSVCWENVVGFDSLGLASQITTGVIRREANQSREAFDPARTAHPPRVPLPPGLARSSSTRRASVLPVASTVDRRSEAGELGARSVAGSWSGRAMETPPPFQESAHCDVCRCTFSTFRRRVRIPFSPHIYISDRWTDLVRSGVNSSLLSLQSEHACMGPA